ncbi:unnamed protein product [Arctia plantaginis]|uniref:Chitin-binding type-2 domain-containing protein n=1 Tax=Arctia plantaginis TaxID=874455 RepID=A0A8S1BTH6_ARCPL|nr:unnamed protein product [Arctia plantaginis]
MCGHRVSSHVSSCAYVGRLDQSVSVLSNSFAVTTLAVAASTTAAAPTTRRLNRIISRRRQSTTTSTTTEPASTTPSTTKEDEYYDTLPDVGDTDAIEDPTLQTKKPKPSFKVQRRPLILKESESDQNPSATNEEENKRQSKKYSASIKQIELDDLVKNVQEESTTDKLTTVEDISPETAVAIAAHQLITAPIPSLTDSEDDDIKPTRNIQTTVEYKYTSREYNEYTNTDSKTPSYEDDQSTPIYKTKILGNDETTMYKTQNDFDSTKDYNFDSTRASDFDIPKTSSQKYITTPEYKTIDYIHTTLGNTYAVDIDSAKISTYDVPKATNSPITVSTISNQDYGRSTTIDYNEPEYDSPKIISTTFPSKSSSTKSVANTITGQSFNTAIDDSYTNNPIDFASSVLSYLPKSDYQSDSVTQNYVRSTNNLPETSTEFVPRNSPSFVTNFASTTYSNRETFDDTVLEENLPRSRISTTLTPPQTSRQAFERTTASQGSNSPRTASSFSPRATEATKLRNDFRSNLATNAVTIGYSGIQRGTSRFRNEKLIPVPVENRGYAAIGYTRSSQAPSYYTREYLLESPVTKTYDEEYQYLLPITTPQTPPSSATRKVIRKKIHRKISTTQQPTTTPSPPTSTTTVRPRRVSAKPFEKVSKEKKTTKKPIANYDYYDDSDEKMAVKYMEGTKVVMHENGTIECLDIGNFPHPTSCKKFISCARIENGSLLGWEYICPKGLSFDPVGGICNWSAGLGCNEKDA